MSGSEPYPLIGFQITTELSQLTIFRATNKTNAQHLIGEKWVWCNRKVEIDCGNRTFPEENCNLAELVGQALPIAVFARCFCFSTNHLHHTIKFSEYNSAEPRLTP